MTRHRPPHVVHQCGASVWRIILVRQCDAHVIWPPVPGSLAKPRRRCQDRRHRGLNQDGSPLQLFAPVGKSLSQIDDPVFIGVILRGLVWSAVCLAGLHMLLLWAVRHFVHFHGVLAWAAGAASFVVASILAAWLFLPLAAAIGLFYLDRIARAVEARFYPFLPPPAGESLALQAWDGVVVGLKVLGLNILALVLAVMLPVVGWFLGWAIAAYAMGRGLFVAVAMRRMPRPEAESVYRAWRGSVIAQGAILAVAAYIPIVNLMIPVIGTAAMVHLLDSAMTTPLAEDMHSRHGSGSLHSI